MDERIQSFPPVATAAARAARKTIQQVAQSAVPALADFVVVFVVTGRSIVGIASAHVSPEGQRLLRALRRIYRVRRDDLHSTVAQVVRTGRAAMRRSILHERTSTAARGSVADLHRRLACRSALVLPICVGDIVTGAVSLCYAGSGRTYRAADLAGARRITRELERMSPPPLLHATPRLRAAIGDPGRHASVRRRMAPRN
jgi:GAF domain-containing protein